MNETPTRAEFARALRDISCGYVSLATAESSEEEESAREQYRSGRKVALAAFAAQGERIAELEAEATWQIGGPPDGELVLVSVHYKHRAGSMWDYYRVLEARWECGKGWREAGGLQIRGHRDVTHWRPLPAPVIPEAHDDEAT